MFLWMTPVESLWQRRVWKLPKQCTLVTLFYLNYSWGWEWMKRPLQKMPVKLNMLLAKNLLRQYKNTGCKFLITLGQNFIHVISSITQKQFFLFGMSHRTIFFSLYWGITRVFALYWYWKVSRKKVVSTARVKGPISAVIWKVFIFNTSIFIYNFIIKYVCICWRTYYWTTFW